MNKKEMKNNKAIEIYKNKDENIIFCEATILHKCKWEDYIWHSSIWRDPIFDRMHLDYSWEENEDD